MRMVVFLLIVLIGLLICIIWEKKKGNEQEKQEFSWSPFLPEYKGKNCEIIVKEPLPYIDIMYSEKGVLLDMDDEWVMLSCRQKKKNVVKILRIDNISSVKEII